METTKKVLVVGSWAKEQITIENIKKDANAEVFCYMDTKNPGIMPLADGYRIGSLCDVSNITNYAKEIKADLVLITTASPLAAGLVDVLEEEGIRAFGPNRQAAMLEYDKAFARELMQKHGIEAIPKFQVFDGREEATEYARKLNWNVAVKPIGLTDGLGVRVFGDQLGTSEDVKRYIEEVLSKKIGGSPKVIVEEKLDGVEFSIQCLVHSDWLLPTPAVQDFKKLLPGEKGPNTASMGSYSGSGHLLPFLRQEEYDEAVGIIRETLKAFRSETGKSCSGFLYGQFMLTKDGVKLIEYNFRPGDPEWLNAVFSLKSNLLDAVTCLMDGCEKSLDFEGKATVCRYIVPKEYPAKANQTLHVSLDEEKIRQEGVALYYSCGLDNNGGLNVGTERGIALIAKGNTIEEAGSKVQNAIGHIQGEFYYRSDIGSAELLTSKTEQVRHLRQPIRIREAGEKDFLEVHKFVSDCKPLENYAEHFYKIMLRYFGSTCLIAEYENSIVGFLMGFRSQNQEGTYFFWQIGVSPKMQGMGIGPLLLEKAEAKCRQTGCKRIELTIDPENSHSQKLFESAGYRNISRKEGETTTVAGNIAVKDYYRPGRHFMLYEKRLA